MYQEGIERREGQGRLAVDSPVIPVLGDSQVPLTIQARPERGGGSMQKESDDEGQPGQKRAAHKEGRQNLRWKEPLRRGIGSRLHSSWPSRSCGALRRFSIPRGSTMKGHTSPWPRRWK